MAHLGSFGTSRPPVEATFDYFGETLRAHPDLSDVAVVDLFGSFGSADGANDVAGMLRSIGSTLVHDDDVEAFWRLARSNRQTMEDLAQFAMDLIAAITDRPTKLPSDSSDGQSPTDTRSEDDSSSRALRVLEGRPDLQVAVIQAQAG